MELLMEEKISMVEFLNRHSGLKGMFIAGTRGINAYKVPGGGDFPLTDEALRRIYEAVRTNIKDILAVNRSRAHLSKTYEELLDNPSLERTDRVLDRYRRKRLGGVPVERCWY